MQWDGNPSNDDDLICRRNLRLKDIKGLSNISQDLHEHLQMPLSGFVFKLNLCLFLIFVLNGKIL